MSARRSGCDARCRKRLRCSAGAHGLDERRRETLHLADLVHQIDVLSTYYPRYRAWDHPPLDRPITTEDYDRAPRLP
jgi:hypothetical protein